MFLRSLGYVRLDSIPDSALERKRNRAMRSALQPLGRRLRQLRTPGEMWPLVIEAAGVLGAVAVCLRLDTPGSSPTATVPTFEHGPDDPEDEASALFRFRFTVPGGKLDARTLELGWADGRTEIDRDTEIAVEIFCEHLGEALDVVRTTGVARIALPPS